jgi:hypothetical protein
MAGIQNDKIFRHFSGFSLDASTLLGIDTEPCRRVDFVQGGESFDLSQDREPVERPVEPRVSLKTIRLARSKIPTSSAGNDTFVELNTISRSWRRLSGQVSDAPGFKVWSLTYSFLDSEDIISIMGRLASSCKRS